LMGEENSVLFFPIVSINGNSVFDFERSG